MAQEHHPLTGLALAPTSASPPVHRRRRPARIPALAPTIALAFLLSAAALLGGCFAPSPRPSPPSTPAVSPRSRTPQSPNPSPPNPSLPGPPAPRAPLPPRENRLSPATHALVTQARMLMSHGNFDGASSTLD